MTFCTCTHPDTVHANEVGPCYASKRNGDPCDCEAFRGAPSQDAGAAPVLSVTEADLRDIAYQVMYLVRNFRERHTLLPETVCLRGRGHQLRFDLVYHEEQWVYEYAGEIQVGGRPGGKWRIPA